MSKYSSFADLWAEVENDDAYWTEKNILDFTTNLYQLMKHRKVSKKELAERLGTSQAYITKIFRGNANFTLASMTKLVQALDAKLDVHVVPKEEHVQQWFKVLKSKSREPVSPQKWGKNLVTERYHYDDEIEVCAG